LASLGFSLLKEVHRVHATRLSGTVPAGDRFVFTCGHALRIARRLLDVLSESHINGMLIASAKLILDTPLSIDRRLSADTKNQLQANRSTDVQACSSCDEHTFA
jgi:hypothetical protein